MSRGFLSGCPADGLCHVPENMYISDMKLIDAIKARHSVRKYLDKPIEAAKVTVLRTTVGGKMLLYPRYFTKFAKTSIQKTSESTLNH